MPRYDRVQDIIRLALWMSGARVGITLGQIQERFGVNRRTAERMRDAVVRIFPEAEARVLADGQKHWRIRRDTAAVLARWSRAELDAVAGAIKLADENGQHDAAEVLREIAEKIRAVLPEEPEYTALYSRAPASAIEPAVEVRESSRRLRARRRISTIVSDVRTRYYRYRT